MMNLTHSGVDANTIGSCLQKRDTELFFLGIGGAGMSALAHLCAACGYRVKGADRARSQNTQLLERAGIEVRIGAWEEAAKKARILIYSLAIGEGDATYLAARRAGVLCVSRAEFAGVWTLRYPTRIGVCGSHGKSTVCAMLSVIFRLAGRDPTVLGGAPLMAGAPAFRAGGTHTVIFESCEYRNSFLRFSPTLSVFLNLEREHVDCFPTIQSARDAFRQMAQITEGQVLYDAEDANLCAALRHTHTPCVCFGEREGATFRARLWDLREGMATFDFYRERECLGTVHLCVPGSFQVHNATAAIATALLCDIPFSDAKEGVQRFLGVPRRMCRFGTWQGHALYYDYAHHPTEMDATLRTLRQMWGTVSVVFAPHTYSRTAALWDDFVEVLRLADVLAIVPVYAAREEPMEGISSEHLAACVPGACALQPAQVQDFLMQRASGAVVLMGAGDLQPVYESLCADAQS